MPTYETIFIAQPGLAETDADALALTFEQLVREGDGTLVKVDHWGKRKLAYAVQKHQEGYFFYLQFEASAGVVSELERRLRNNEQVLKYLSVKLDRHAVEALALAEKKAAEKAAARALRDAERAARLEEGKGPREGDLDAPDAEGAEDEDED